MTEHMATFMISHWGELALIASVILSFYSDSKITVSGIEASRTEISMYNFTKMQ